MEQIQKEQAMNDADYAAEQAWQDHCDSEFQAELDAANEKIKRMESFINRFLDPEDLGYVVNNYVRDDAREALGRERVESKNRKEKP
jgi:hypothetical protein